MVDIRQMRSFVVLAETLHFGRAAARLNLSQPPLTRQIAALEKELGVRLLERHSRHTRLTRAGARFVLDARAAIAQFDQACRNVRLAERGEVGELTLGFMMHAAYTVVPRLARRFTSAFPGVDLTLREVVPGAIVSEVLAGRFDVGIVLPAAATRVMEERLLHREPMLATLHRDHPLAARTTLAPADFYGVPLIATRAEVAPVLRRAVTDYLEAAGVTPVIALEVELQQTILSLVAEDLGVAIVPSSMRRLAIENVVFIDLERPPSIDHVALWRPDNANPALRSFLSVLDRMDEGAPGF